MKKLLFPVLVLVVIVCSRCDRKHSPDISGFWYSISNDTTYEETILTNDALWSYSFRIGEIYRNYEIDGDSIAFSDSMNRVVLNFSVLSPNEFVLKNSFNESHYYRVDLSIDLKKIMQNDPAARQEYMDGYKLRKKNWKKDNNLIQ